MYDPEWFKQAIKDGPEVQLALIITYLDWNVRLIEPHQPPQPRSELLTTLLQLEAAVRATSRFGIFPESNHFCPELPSAFQQWASWWDRYLHTLSADQMTALEKALKTKADVSVWRPTGDWRQPIAA